MTLPRLLHSRGVQQQRRLLTFTSHVAFRGLPYTIAIRTSRSRYIEPLVKAGRERGHTPGARDVSTIVPSGSRRRRMTCRRGSYRGQGRPRARTRRHPPRAPETRRTWNFESSLVRRVDTLSLRTNLPSLINVTRG